MMKVLVKFALCLLPCLSFGQKIITKDVGRFWNAYDKIIFEKDSIKQVDLINKLYIQKGTSGLDGIMRARRYTAEEFVYAINHYPAFWTSIRNNTLRCNEFKKEIKIGIEKLKEIYPSLKPVNIYFEIGVLRTGGTTIDNMLLIGSEIGLADASINTSELEEDYPHLQTFFNTEPVKNVVFLNIHEYIHTQQKETIGNTLLSQTVMEGVAEFLAEVALNMKSPNPQIAYGIENDAAIKAAFEREMFSPNIYNWIMNSSDNDFGMRDLGYYVGYAICKNYYKKSQNKIEAIKEMIELDYNNEIDLIRFVETSNYFDSSLLHYKTTFEKNRPTVAKVGSFDSISPNEDMIYRTITLHFSQTMNPESVNFDYGPLGEDVLPKITNFKGFSEDNKSYSLEMEIKANTQYQLMIGFGFCSKDNYPLVPYLIDFVVEE